jgi:hypothetical protein
MIHLRNLMSTTFVTQREQAHQQLSAEPAGLVVRTASCFTAGVAIFGLAPAQLIQCKATLTNWRAPLVTKPTYSFR